MKYISKNAAKIFVFTSVFCLAGSALGQLPNLKKVGKFGKKVQKEVDNTKKTETEVEKTSAEVKSATLSECSRLIENDLRMFNSKLEKVNEDVAERGVNSYNQNEVRKLEMLKESLDRKQKECAANNELASSTDKSYQTAMKEFEACKAKVNGAASDRNTLANDQRRLSELKEFLYQFPTGPIQGVEKYCTPILTKAEIDVFRAGDPEKHGDYLASGARSIIEMEEKINSSDMDAAVKRSFQEWDVDVNFEAAKERLGIFIASMTYFQDNLYPDNQRLVEWIDAANTILKKY